MSLMFLRVANKLINIDEIASLVFAPPEDAPGAWITLKSGGTQFLTAPETAVAKYYFNTVIPAVNPAVIEDAQRWYDQREENVAMFAGIAAQRAAQAAAARAEAVKNAPAPAEKPKPRLLVMPKRETRVFPPSWNEGGV